MVATEPAAHRAVTGAHRRASVARGGGVAVLTVYLVLIFAIPSRLIIGALGGAGTPAGVFGLFLLVLWSFYRLSSGVRRRRSAVNTAMGLFALALLASYLVAATRPITGIEISAADRGLLSLGSWLGVMLVASELLVSRSDVDSLLRRLVAGGGLLAGLGLVQFVTGLGLTNYIQIPGLSENGDLESVLDRGLLNRPAGTAIHPLEFAAVLTMILPIALHYALTDTKRSGFARWAPVVAIAFAVPISISRSAIVSAAVALAFVFASWPKRWRRRGYGGVVVVLLACYVAVPGLVGTLLSLFTGISGDNSAASRTNSYGLAEDFISRSPWFGRGFGTFLPTYRILDNQLLGLLISVGVIGFVAFLAVVVTAISRGLAMRTRGVENRRLGSALAGAIAATATSFALFDGLSFPMVAGLLFLVIGCVAALDRTTTPRRAVPMVAQF